MIKPLSNDEKLGPSCIREYFKLKGISISESTADFDNGNSIYTMKFHALLSIFYFKDGMSRQALEDELKAVMAKVKSSFAGPPKQFDHVLDVIKPANMTLSGNPACLILSRLNQLMLIL